MTTDLSNKTALITGASRGIGKEIARLFANAGANVIVHFNKNEAAAQKTLKSLKPGKHTIISADIADYRQVEELSENVFERYIKVDILVNNAGVYEEFDIMSLNYESWRKTWEKTIQTNLSGAANLSFLVAKRMKDLGGCRIVNVSSRGAFRGEPNAPAYGASKAGMNSFGQSFAKAFAKHKIYVFTVAPGFVETDMAASCMVSDRGNKIKSQSPLNRVASPEEIARTVLFLASEGSEYLTGCIIDQNGASYLRS
ncbi:MAG: SDR family oxidoreductase [Bacteroidales bacterium]|nr:SDR family oxidoreductase [Bacteroidales bacterium]